MSHLFISAAHKSSGKTTLSIGLCAALRARGRVVQPFKKGPDYIDPLWLSQAAGRPCYNLDFYTMARDEIGQTFREQMGGADLGLIEGNKGLYDGLDLDGSNSNAALAALLGAPVVLVLDTRGMTRGVAPLILGYQAFDPKICIAGVILNHVGGARHEGKLRQVIEHYTDVRVVGAVPQARELEIVERHLGLMPSNESREAAAQVERLGARIGSAVDLDAVLAIAAQAAPVVPAPRAEAAPAPSVRIGIAQDEASASTTRATSRPCVGPAQSWCPSTPFGMPGSPMSTGCSSAAAFRRRGWGSSRRTRRCARQSLPSSRPAVPPTRNAAASCTWRAPSPGTAKSVKWPA